MVFFIIFLELEAKEACDWLRAAGFPQYAQLYEGKAAWFIYSQITYIKLIKKRLEQIILQ